MNRCASKLHHKQGSSLKNGQEKNCYQKQTEVTDLDFSNYPVCIYSTYILCRGTTKPRGKSIILPRSAKCESDTGNAQYSPNRVGDSTSIRTHPQSIV